MACAAAAHGMHCGRRESKGHCAALLLLVLLLDDGGAVAVPQDGRANKRDDEEVVAVEDLDHEAVGSWKI